MPPRRIAFCITDLDAGGAERALLELVVRLPKADWEPRVFCLGPEAELSGALRQRGIPVDCLGARSSRDWGVLRQLTNRLKEFQPEILQTFLFHANVVGRIAGRRAGVPHIVSGLRVAERQKTWHAWVDRLTGVSRHHAICVSQGVSDWARQRLKIPAQNLLVIPNGVDFDRFSGAPPLDLSPYGIEPKARVIVAIGRLHPQKGFDSLITAVSPSLQDHPDLHLLIAGEGPDRSHLESLVRQAQEKTRGAPPQIHLPGRITDVPGLLRRACLYVLSSRWEGMPNALLEALAAGRPVIATRAEGVVDAFGDADSPCLVNPNSVPELRQAIEGFLKTPGPVQEASSRSQQFIRETFTIDRSAQLYQQFYLSLLAR